LCTNKLKSLTGLPRGCGKKLACLICLPGGCAQKNLKLNKYTKRLRTKNWKA